MAYVEILKLQKDGNQQVVATCTLNGNQVELTGDPIIVKNLREKGIKNYQSDGPQIIYPTDGRIFLEQLKNNFKSGYLNATDVRED